METALGCYALLEAMALEGNPNSVSDAGVGVLAATAAVRGAHLNVKINASGLKDRDKAQELLAKAERIEKEALALEEAILVTVNSKI